MISTLFPLTTFIVVRLHFAHGVVNPNANGNSKFSNLCISINGSFVWFVLAKKKNYWDQDVYFYIHSSTHDVRFWIYFRLAPQDSTFISTELFWTVVHLSTVTYRLLSTQHKHYEHILLQFSGKDICIYCGLFNIFFGYFFWWWRNICSWAGIKHKAPDPSGI